MNEDQIRILIREEFQKAMRPVLLALKQGNNTVTRAIDEACSLGDFKSK
jgi:hypothetical protein